MKIFKHIGGFTKKWDPLKMNKKKNLKCNKHSTDCRLQSLRMLFDDDKIYHHMAIAQYVANGNDKIFFYLNHGDESDEWGIKSHFKDGAFNSGSMEYKENVENFKENIIDCFKRMKPGYARIHTLFWNDKTITKNDLGGNSRKYHVVVFARDEDNNLFILDPKHHNIFKNNDIFNVDIWGKSVGIGGLPPYLSEEIYNKSEKNYLKIIPVIKKENEPGSLDLNNLTKREKELNDNIIEKLKMGSNKLSDIEEDAFSEFRKSPKILNLLNEAIRKKEKICAKKVFQDDKKLKDAYDLKLENIIKISNYNKIIKENKSKYIKKKYLKIIEKIKSNQKIIDNFIQKRIEYINKGDETKKEDISLSGLQELNIPDIQRVTVLPSKKSKSIKTRKRKGYFTKTKKNIRALGNKFYEKKSQAVTFLTNMFKTGSLDSNELLEFNNLVSELSSNSSKGMGVLKKIKVKQKKEKEKVKQKKEKGKVKQKKEKGKVKQKKEQIKKETRRKNKNI